MGREREGEKGGERAREREREINKYNFGCVFLAEVIYDQAISDDRVDGRPDIGEQDDAVLDDSSPD